jgi:hypothetical protein
MRPPNRPKKNFEIILFGFLGKLFYIPIQAFMELSDAEHKRFVERFSITISVGMACILSSFFYWVLPPLTRTFIIPIFIGAAWWIGANVIAKFFDMQQEFEGFDPALKAVEVNDLINAIKFSAATLALAVIPFAVMPAKYAAALDNADVRTLFLGMFIWNLIGAPLFAQARDRKSKLIIVLVFAVPVLIATICWVNSPYHGF